MGIGAFRFDWVLGGKHTERAGQLVSLALDGHLFLLHGFKQCGLHLGRCTDDLIGKDKMGKDRTT